MADILGFASESFWPWESVIGVLPEEGNLLEVGTYCGLSASIWAKKFPKYMVHTVDIALGVPSTDQDNPAWISREEQLNSIHQVVENHENLSFSEGDFFIIQRC